MKKKHSTYSNNTINKIVSSVTLPLKETYRLGIISINPVRGAYRLPDRSKEKGVFTDEEIKAIAGAEWDNEAASLAFRLAAVTGMRLGEIRALRMQDLHDYYIIVSHSYSKVSGLKSTKSGKARLVSVPQIIIMYFKYLGINNPHNNGWVFWGTNKTLPIGDKIITDLFYKAMESIGISERKKSGIYLSTVSVITLTRLYREVSMMRS